MLRQFIPFFDASIQSWTVEARLLRWLTFLWLLIGLVVLFSASYPSGFTEHNDGLYYFKRQLIWIVIGVVGFQWMVHTPLRRLLNLSSAGLLICLGLILATKIPGFGTQVNGATRWLTLGPIQIQPSELIKPFLVLQSAQVFGQWERLAWKVRATWLGIFGFVLLGILIQPNLSTTALCGITLWLVALAAGLPYLQLGGTAVLGFLTAVVSITAKEYQRRRVMSFLNPWQDAAGDGYQLIQSLLAIGSGGPLGAGYGLSQQKLSYLPFQHTDFIFAVFAEEFGLVGCLLMPLLLTVYGGLGLRVVLKTTMPIYRLIGVGAVVIMLGQAFLNIAVSAGVLPTTGLPFPLMSSGGSSMVASLLIAGLLIRTARECNQPQLLNLPTGGNSESSGLALETGTITPTGNSGPSPRRSPSSQPASLLERLQHRLSSPPNLDAVAVV